MKYALFLYDNEDFQTLPEAEQMEIVSQYAAYSELLEKAGAFVFGEPLDHSTTGKTLKADGAVQDGPYADTKEQLGGFYIIEAETIDAAMDWARKCPSHQHGGQIEVRPVPDYMDG